MSRMAVLCILLITIFVGSLLVIERAGLLYAGMVQWLPIAREMLESTDLDSRVSVSNDDGDDGDDNDDGDDGDDGAKRLEASFQEKWQQILGQAKLPCPQIIHPLPKDRLESSFSHSANSANSANAAHTANSAKQNYLNSLSAEISRCLQEDESTRALMLSRLHWASTLAWMFKDYHKGGLSLARLRFGLQLLSSSLDELEKSSKAVLYSPQLGNSLVIKRLLLESISLFPLSKRSIIRRSRIVPSISKAMERRETVSTIEVNSGRAWKKSLAFYPDPKTFDEPLPSASRAIRYKEKMWKELRGDFGIRGIDEDDSSLSFSLQLLFHAVYDLESLFLDILLLSTVPKDLLLIFQEECQVLSDLKMLFMKWAKEDFEQKHSRTPLHIEEILNDYSLPDSLLIDPVTGRQLGLNDIERQH